MGIFVGPAVWCLCVCDVRICGMNWVYKLAKNGWRVGAKSRWQRGRVASTREKGRNALSSIMVI